MTALSNHFRFWQTVLAGGHYGAAAAIIALTDGGVGWAVPVIIRFNIWTSSDGRCSGDTGCTINEYERVLSAPLNTGALVASFSFISGTHHAICAALGDAYIKNLAENYRGVSVLRWVDYAWSASLMLMMDSVLWLSPPTIQQLVLTFCVMFLVIVSGYGSEVAWSCGEKGHAILVFILACLPFVCTWAVTWATFGEGLNPKEGSYAVRSTTLGAPDTGSSPPDFVIVILVWLFITYCSFPAAHAWRIWTQTPSINEDDAIKAESVYSFLSFFAKIPLLAVYGTAVAARSNRITVGTPPPEDVGSMPDNTFAALGTSIAVSIVLGVVMWLDLRRLFADKSTPLQLKPVKSSIKSTRL